MMFILQTIVFASLLVVFIVVYLYVWFNAADDGYQTKTEQRIWCAINIVLAIVLFGGCYITACLPSRHLECDTIKAEQTDHNDKGSEVVNAE